VNSGDVMREKIVQGTAKGKMKKQAEIAIELRNFYIDIFPP
jgi:hypothetical protein